MRPLVVIISVVPVVPIVPVVIVFILSILVEFTLSYKILNFVLKLDIIAGVVSDFLVIPAKEVFDSFFQDQT